MRIGQLNVFHVHNDNRVICLLRWIEGEGHDVVAAFSLREQTWYGYRVGFPGAGFWREVFNSDVYQIGSTRSWLATGPGSWRAAKRGRACRPRPRS